MNEAVLIDASELAAVDPEAVLVVDCRFDLGDPEKGRRDYLHGHLPGAVYASLDTDLSDLDKMAQELGRHPLPDPDAFARTLSSWGWTPQLQVVAYDTMGGAMAARLWWMLRCVGADVRVLDGGLAAWKNAGLDLQTGPVERTPTQVDLHFDAAKMLYSDALANALQEDTIVLMDARATPRYRGETEPLDRVAGHVPGALNRPFKDNLDASGRFRDAEVLRAQFEQLLDGRAAGDSVHMCGSGVTACHNLLAMEHAGLSGSRLYPPSWSGWISDRKRPVATGGNAA